MAEASLELILHEQVLDAVFVELILHAGKGRIHLVLLSVDDIRCGDWGLPSTGLVSMHHFSLRA